MKRVEGRPFWGGVPIALDLQKLEDRYGIPEPGTFLPHREIAECLGVLYPSPRYRTVTDAWRSKLFSGGPNIDTGCDPGQGIRFLLPNERYDASKKDFRSATRKTRKSNIRVHVIPDDAVDDPVLRAQIDHLRGVTARVEMLMAKEWKSIAPPPPPPQVLPRRSVAT